MAQRGKYVLVAMLDVKRAAAFGNVLVELGHDVRTARDGEEAQQLISRFGAPLLLITDISLPKVDGVTLIRNLRREAPADAAGAIVISAHEPLRARARQLAPSLGIARVLPPDVDRLSLREALQSAVPHPPVSPSRTGTEAFAGEGSRLDDLLVHAVVDAVRRFRVPLAIAYLKVGAREQVTAHFNIANPSAMPLEGPDMTVLRNLAAAREPLILPDLEAQSLQHEMALSPSGTVRGFAAVPLTLEHSEGVGILCLLDGRPLSLGAKDLDDLAASAADISRQVEGEIEPPPPVSHPPRDLKAEEIKALEILAVTDPLTGLANRRGGEQNITSEISRAKRQKSSLSCILVDIDRFKEVNDTYGHQAGDHVLREISALLRRTLRGYDILIRWGGEEFLIVLPGVDLQQARRLAERVRSAVEALETQGIGPVTVSAGAATLGSDYDFESMLALADHRLYQAKAAGRNCVA